MLFLQRKNSPAEVGLAVAVQRKLGEPDYYLTIAQPGRAFMIEPRPRQARSGQLIRRMNAENPLWGAPRIHGELLKLGFEGRSVERREVHGHAMICDTSQLMGTSNNTRFR